MKPRHDSECGVPKKNWVCDFFQVMRLTLKNCSNSRYFSLDMPTKVIINAIKTICVYIKNRPWHKFVRKNSKMFWETAVIEIFRKCSLPANDVHKLLRKCFIFLPSIMAFKFSKSTWGEQLVEDIPNFTCIFVYVFISVTSPGQTKNDTDLIFGTHTRIDLI